MVASFIHACKQRAHDDPPDAVLFDDPVGDPVGDTVEGSDEFYDCSEGDDVDIFQLRDRVLASEGFVPGTP
jgi:hypothetical protein